MNTKQYNILIINWQDITHPLGGGAEVHAHEIFRRVAAKGHHVTFLCCRYGGAATSEWIDGMRVIRCGSRNTFNFLVPFVYQKLNRTYNFDIVFDDINKIPFFTPLFVKKPLIAIVHHFFGKSIFMQASYLQAQYVCQSERLVPFFYRNTPFAVVSDSTRKELRDKGISTDIYALPNAVDVQKYSWLHQKEDKPLIGYLGRLKKYKKIDHLIKALPEIFSHRPDAWCVIIGDGDYKASLIKLVDRLELRDRVHFTGHVTHKEKVQWLNRLWVAVNPSPKEGWGLTVIEANACGVPVIASDSPGLRDSVVHEKTGYLYPYGDLSKMKDYLNMLLDDAELRNKLAVQSRRWAESFQWDASADHALDIIEKITKKQH
ncbi:MAG: glycosyltransferase family 4 protein [candidate division KSB1 bacterium]|nr:glycosyltransferase family 4 protein [candidate division KSB1 bacterium]